jgi:hypothetical protein
MWPGSRFGAPYFIHYGQNGGSVTNDDADKYVYSISNNGFWDDGDDYILGRVPRSKISALNPATSGTEHRATGYSWLISRNGTKVYNSAGGSGATFNTALPARTYLNKLNVTYNSSVALSDSEMITDIIISSPNGKTSDIFVGVYDDSGTAALPYGMNSSHMAGRTPSGENVLFQDIHVDWRKFQNVQPWLIWSNGRHIWF